MSNIAPGEVPSILVANKARNRAALQLAAKQYLKEFKLPPGKIYSSPFSYRALGAILISGQAAKFVAIIKKKAYHIDSKTESEIPLVKTPIDQLNQSDLPLLFDLRLLQRQWKTLPAASGSSSRLTRSVMNKKASLLAAFELGDGEKQIIAIKKISKLEPYVFSVLAYALYQEAKKMNPNITIPHKYNF